MTELMLTPEKWGEMDGIRVLDPDGWRVDGKSWDELITRAEWERRWPQSTVDASGWIEKWSR